MTGQDYGDGLDPSHLEQTAGALLLTLTLTPSLAVELFNTGESLFTVIVHY